MNNFRIGIGFDVHKLVKGKPLILGGIDIEFEKGALGHSDADVLIHAICDAMLGAASLDDIGVHFPDNDDTFKDIPGEILLTKTLTIIKNKGFKIVNIDSTVILEKPRLREYIPKIREKIAAIVNVNIDSISVKATTTEGLGYTGEGKGVAAQAVVLLIYENNN
jgi:2-C-methyl-D-erythritol 2,4-cyclodiphosphate synthase